MTDLLAAAAAFTAVVAAGLAALALLTLVPFVLALRRAEQRGFDPARWGAVALVGSVLGVGLALVALRSSLVLLLLAVPLAFAGVLALLVLPADSQVGGRAGRHQ